MPHVDEGTLHSYLDAEMSSAERAALESHLATCEACRELLAEERALRQRASALLGATRPEERPVPAFEHVRRDPKRSPWHVRTPLAWAASIILAVGVGYVLRGGPLRQYAAPVSQLESRSEPTQAPPASVEPSNQGREQKAAQPSSAYARGQRVQTRDARQAQTADVAVVDSLARRDSAPGVVALQPSAVPLRGASPTARQREADSLAALARRSEVVLEEAVVTAAPAARASSTAGTVTIQGNARRNDESVRNLVATTWPLISRGKAASLLGDRPVGVPGLATRHIRQSPGADSTVVVEQALDSNTVIQIFQRPASVGRYDTAPGALSYGGVERERADRVLARYVGRLRVEISGPLSTDSLNKLLEQVEPIR